MILTEAHCTMKVQTVPGPIDRFLTRTLSGTVFTWQEIWNLLLPGVMDSMSIMFINMLITALISKNGETSVAAVSLVGPVTALIVNVFNGISAGGTVVVAQCCGRKNPIEKKKAMSITLWSTIVIGLIVCLPMLLFPGFVIQLLYPGAESAVSEKARIYLWGCAWSILLFTVYTAIFAILRGLGESKRCLALSIIINVAYFVFSIIFLNFLKMDIQGSVFALILARLLGTCSAVFLLFFWKPPERLGVRDLFSFDGTLLRSVLKVGIPLSIEQVFIALGGVVAGMYMTLLGTASIATNAITNSLIGLLYSPAMSIGSLTVTVVGRCIGANKMDEAAMYSKRCRQIALLLLVVTCAVFYPCLPLLLKQYNPSEESARMASMLLYCSIPALLLFWPASYITPNALRAANDTIFPSVLSLSVLWLITICLGYVLAIHVGFGLWGVWIATWSSWFVRAVGFGLRSKTRKWNYGT